jgi:hypothetical protein
MSLRLGPAADRLTYCARPRVRRSANVESPAGFSILLEALVALEACPLPKLVSPISGLFAAFKLGRAKWHASILATQSFVAISYAARIHPATTVWLRSCQIPNANSGRDQHGREKELMHFAPFCWNNPRIFEPTIPLPQTASGQNC